LSQFDGGGVLSASRPSAVWLSRACLSGWLARYGWRAANFLRAARPGLLILRRLLHVSCYRR